MNSYRILTHGSLGVLLACGFTACERQHGGAASLLGGGEESREGAEMQHRRAGAGAVRPGKAERASSKIRKASTPNAGNKSVFSEHA